MIIKTIIAVFLFPLIIFIGGKVANIKFSFGRSFVSIIAGTMFFFGCMMGFLVLLNVKVDSDDNWLFLIIVDFISGYIYFSDFIKDDKNN